MLNHAGSALLAQNQQRRFAQHLLGPLARPEIIQGRRVQHEFVLLLQLGAILFSFTINTNTKFYSVANAIKMYDIG